MILGMSIYQILWYFMIYSVLGWIIEVSFHAVTLGKVVNRGFLNGPLCPVYGSGVLMVLTVVYVDGMLFGFETDLQKANTFGLFIVGIVFATLIELIAGFALDKLFHARWWDYRGMKFNLNGYICLAFSIIWGLAIAFVLRVVQPMFEAFVSWIPTIGGWIALAIMYVIFILDITATVLTVLKFNKHLENLCEIEAAIRKISDGMSEVIGEGTLKMVEKLEEGQQKTEQQKEEIMESVGRTREELEKMYEHLRKSLMYHRLFGMGRLLQALAQKGSTKYQDMLDKLRM
ncbi:MAG: putative ABC transporter permease [Lachnospiraceae bacterium]|nr:putative ABC transporter permease [Lachnospiraceae bacterium]